MRHRLFSGGNVQTDLRKHDPDIAEMMNYSENVLSMGTQAGQKAGSSGTIWDTAWPPGMN